MMNSKKECVQALYDTGCKESCGLSVTPDIKIEGKVFQEGHQQLNNRKELNGSFNSIDNTHFKAFLLGSFLGFVLLICFLKATVLGG